MVFTITVKGIYLSQQFAHHVSQERIKRIKAEKGDYRKSEEAIMRMVKENIAEVHEKHHGGSTAEEREEL